MKRFIILAAVVLPLSLHAQYWSDYVLEKGFDERDYFLRPHRIVGLSLKNLDEGLLGILPDPLSEMSFQPAMLSSISGTRLYIDLKGSSEKKKKFKYRVYPTFYYDNARFAPSYWAQPVERKLEPLLSAIYIGDLAAKYLPGLKYSISYELIHHQGTFYEYVPYWYYGGYDAFGVRAEGSQNFPEIDPTIKQDGLDEKSETAHLLDGHLSFKLASFLSVGAKVSRVQTEVSGNYARLNNYDYPSEYRYQSRYLNYKSTASSLWQNDFSGGILLSIDQTRQLGFFAGLIDGNHEQSGADVDSSFYSYGENPQSVYYSRSRYSHVSQSRWLHDGTTRYAGVHGQLPMQNDVAFRFRFEYQKSTIDLSNAGAVIDTSYSHYRWQYYDDNQIYDSIYSSRFDEQRASAGEENVTRKIAAAGIVVPMYKQSYITVGAFAESAESDMVMYEDAQVRRASHQHTATPWNPIESRIGIQDKTVRLDRDKTISRLALPIAMNFYFGRGWTAYLGVIKQQQKVESEEIVDIWFRTDSTVIVRPEGTSTQNPAQRIDRYVAVPVRRSESSTDFHFGVSFEPSRRVRFEVGMGTTPTELDNWQFAFVLSL
jgi:hypothetical protein